MRVAYRTIISTHYLFELLPDLHLLDLPTNIITGWLCRDYWLVSNWPVKGVTRFEHLLVARTALVREMLGRLLRKSYFALIALLEG